jgi:hypothetical protein
MVEKRQHKRTPVPKGVFVALRSDLVEVGQVVDMSLTGLGFRYVPHHAPSNGPSELLIFSRGNAYLYRIPFKTVWDKELKGLPFNSATRCCGVQFGELAPLHAFQLEYLIQKYNTGDA